MRNNSKLFEEISQNLFEVYKNAFKTIFGVITKDEAYEKRCDWHIECSILFAGSRSIQSSITKKPKIISKNFIKPFWSVYKNIQNGNIVKTETEWNLKFNLFEY